MNTQDEFKTLLMLYAANIDGTIHPDEVELILQHVDPAVVSKLKKDFSKMSDTQILDLIHENKSKFITSWWCHPSLQPAGNTYFTATSSGRPRR